MAEEWSRAQKFAAVATAIAALIAALVGVAGLFLHGDRDSPASDTAASSTAVSSTAVSSTAASSTAASSTAASTAAPPEPSTVAPDPAPATQPSPAGTAPAPSPLSSNVVLVRVGAALGEGMYAANVQYSVDGARQADLVLDQFSRQRAAGIQLVPGEHRYDVVVDWVDVSGVVYADSGAGTLTAGAGLAYEVVVDGAGTAALIVSP